MPDGSYQPKVYRKQGGDELVVASGGVITIESGGAIDNEGDLFTAFDVDGTTLQVIDDEMSIKAVARSLITADALAEHGIPLTSVRGATGLSLVATETAGGFNVSLSSDVLILQGEVTDNETEVSVCVAEYVLPDNYVAEGDITVRIRAAIIKTAAGNDNGSTLDLSVFKQGDGAVGSDLCDTAAQTFAAVNTWYDNDFTVTATGLAAGDRLTLKITSSVVDDEAGGGTLRMNIAKLSVLADVQG